MSDIRKLRADEIECKVSTVSEKGCSLLLYKTARTDMTILDEVFKPDGWQCSYEEIHGNLFCTIKIWSETACSWVSKQDCGVESAFGDKEKGEASDAFKRAGFKVGIGRELYSAPFIWVGNFDVKIEKKFDQKTQKDKFFTYDRFSVEEIGYAKNGDINMLKVRNDTKDRTVYQFGAESSVKKVEEKNKNGIDLNAIKEELDIIDDVQSIREWFARYCSKNKLTADEKTAITKFCEARKNKIESNANAN